MAIKNYIFIYFILSIASIESKKGYSRQFVDGNILNNSPSAQLIGFNSSYCCQSGLDNPSGIIKFQSTDIEVVINEVMADPTPVTGLPDREYIELYNPGNASVNLKGWILGLGTKQKIFPEVLIAAGGYLLVTGSGGSKDMQSFGAVVEISGFSLTNSGLTITLNSPENRWTDQLVYSPILHTKSFQDGGYSLERIDPGRSCGQRYNWATSFAAKGGTPGNQNSVYASNPDLLPPQIIRTLFADNYRLDIKFSESFLFPGNPIDGIKNVPAGISIDSIKTDLTECQLHIYFRPASIKNGINYSLLVSGLADECGNVMKDQSIKFGFYLPVKSDLLINEILFNPYPDGSDFVEIYNNSGHEVDLSGLWLANRDEKNALSQMAQLTTIQNYLQAKSYLALTKSREGILSFYQTKDEECLLQMEKFPSLADLSGCVALLNKDGSIIDEMKYDDKMHHPFITETEGISLERLSFTEPAFKRDNWHSAAKSAGFATPGYENSVLEMNDSVDYWVEIDPLVFSPNGDGINDKLNIYINAGEPGWLLTITILNYAGVVVRKLANNFTTGTSDKLYWDGLTSDFQNVQPGIYIVLVSLFEQTGKHKSRKFACVVSDRP